MRKIIGYKVLKSNFDISLNEEIEKLVSSGWEPTGDIQIFSEPAHWAYFQPMVKWSEEDE